MRRSSTSLTAFLSLALLAVGCGESDEPTTALLDDTDSSQLSAPGSSAGIESDDAGESAYDSETQEPGRGSDDTTDGGPETPPSRELVPQERDAGAPPAVMPPPPVGGPPPERIPPQQDAGTPGESSPPPQGGVPVPMPVEPAPPVGAPTEPAPTPPGGVAVPMPVNPAPPADMPTEPVPRPPGGIVVPVPINPTPTPPGEQPAPPTVVVPRPIDPSPGEDPVMPAEPSADDPCALDQPIIRDGRQTFLLASEDDQTCVRLERKIRAGTGITSKGASYEILPLRVSHGGTALSSVPDDLLVFYPGQHGVGGTVHAQLETQTLWINSRDHWLERDERWEVSGFAPGVSRGDIARGDAVPTWGPVLLFPVQ